VNSDDVGKLLIYLGSPGEWAAENGMAINPHKRKAISFTRAAVEDALNYYLLDRVIPEGRGCKYNNNNNNKLQLGYHPEAVVILHVHKYGISN
jgi:hypothetical protein